MGSTTVIATFETPGFHNWPGAPDEVDFLRVRHRHLFKFRVETVVEHGDRAVEFFQLRERAPATLMIVYPTQGYGREFGSSSCEMIAAKLLAHCRGLSAVEVWEDGESGARVTR